MDLRIDQPIAALASPPGRAARGILRISGDQVQKVLNGWFDPDDVTEWLSAKSPRNHSGTLRLIDEGQTTTVPVQVLYWPNRRSYTGQPLIELHLPGAPCLLEAVLGESFRRGARPARPGEFTMRAFLAGKLDLLQAEAVLGVIDASDHRELQQALAQLAGGVSQRLASLRRDLLELLADLEAGLDFVDEDIEFVGRDEVIRRLGSACEFIGHLLQQSQNRMQARVKPTIVIAGLPNAGKSTLFNRLAGAASALVSDERGTTRDFLVRSATWDDFSFDLIDTAGWENDTSGIAAAAQSHRAAQLEQCDLLIWCSAATLSDEERILDNRLIDEVLTQKPDAIRLLTKNDLAPQNSNQLSVSAVSNQGISDLQVLLRTRLGTQSQSHNQWLGVTAARCRETLESVLAALENAVQAAKSRETGDELIAVDLRDALEHLGAILGVIYTDDILDRIFSKFCIGK